MFIRLFIDYIRSYNYNLRPHSRVCVARDLFFHKAKAKSSSLTSAIHVPISDVFGKKSVVMQGLYRETKAFQKKRSAAALVVSFHYSNWIYVICVGVPEEFYSDGTTPLS